MTDEERNATPAATGPLLEQLWTLKRTLDFIADYYGDEAEIAKPYSVIIASEIVYDYEANRNDLQAEIDRLTADLEAVREMNKELSAIWAGLDAMVLELMAERDAANAELDNPLWPNEDIDEFLRTDAYQDELGAWVIQEYRARAVIEFIRREYETDRNDLCGVIDQYKVQLAAANAELNEMREDRRQSDKDWLALVRMIAEVNDTEEWRLADDATLLEQFDPWQALRELKAELDRLRADIDEILGIGTPHLDGLTETQLERYSQLSPPEIYRLLLAREAGLESTEYGEGDTDEQ